MVSTYLLLVLLSLLLINSFVNASLIKYMMEDKKDNLLSQATIISDQIAPSFLAIDTSQSHRFVESSIKNLSLRISSRVLVVNRFKTVRVDSYDEYSGKTLDGVLEVDNALKGISSAQEYNFDDTGKTVYVGVPIYESGDIIGAMLISSSPEDIFSEIKEISSNFYRLSIGAIIITAVVSFIFTDIMSTPIESLTAVVKDVSRGNKNQKARIFSRDELGNLAEAFNNMITKLYHVDERRKKFVSNVSHELRTPIASMKIISETLTHSKPKDIEVYHDFMMDIDGELTRLSHIIDTLLNLVNLEKDELDLEYQMVNVNNVLRRCIHTLRPLAEQKQIDLEYMEVEQVMNMMDANKVAQCVINIVNNAIKYTPQGGYVGIQLYGTKDDVIIKVRDTGIGIPEEDLPHIFDRFYRVDSARARETGGSGLGLSIAYQIVTLHQGRINVHSEVNAGTTFYIILPKKLDGEVYG